MSFAELAVIIIVALFVINPKQLPTILRNLGKILSHFRNFSDQAKNVIEEQAKLEILKNNEDRAAQADEQYKNEHD